MFQIIDLIEDKKLACYSVLTKVGIKDFVDYIASIHEEGGNLEEQRAVVQTRSAKLIRKRMIEDVQGGALLPAIVLGAVSDNFPEENIEEFLKNIEPSIIDGMQRTEAIRQAYQNAPDIAENKLRVEFWIAKQPQMLVYRMLVLNSGQIPWKLPKQLAVVFRDVIKYLEKEFSLHLEEKEAGFYAELFALFTTRRLDMDKQDILADNFAILDSLEILRENKKVLTYFGTVLSFLERINQITLLDSSIKTTNFKPKDGLFSAPTATVGFVVACAVYILGKAGTNPTNYEQKYQALRDIFDDFIQKAESSENRFELFAVDVLDEMMGMKQRGDIGAKQRSFFAESFKDFLNNYHEISTLEPCWRVNF